MKDVTNGVHDAIADAIWRGVGSGSKPEQGAIKRCRKPTVRVRVQAKGRPSARNIR